MKRVSKQDRELIEKWIELDPRKPWEGEAQIKTTGPHIWALIGYMDAADGDLDVVAGYYDLPAEAMQAAYAYYRLHWHSIEARLAIDAAAAEAIFRSAK